MVGEDTWRIETEPRDGFEANIENSTSGFDPIFGTVFHQADTRAIRELSLHVQMRWPILPRGAKSTSRAVRDPAVPCELDFLGMELPETRSVATSKNADTRLAPSPANQGVAFHIIKRDDKVTRRENAPLPLSSRDFRTISTIPSSMLRVFLLGIPPSKLEPFDGIHHHAGGTWFAPFRCGSFTHVEAPILLRSSPNGTSVITLDGDVRSALSHDPNNIVMATDRCSHHRRPARIAKGSRTGSFRVSAAVQQHLHRTQICVRACVCERRPTMVMPVSHTLRCEIDSTLPF
ncbi:hypothetical protein HO173_004735 [Letharia columbiana]|uniref:Uncharacterized protein n=1 Tax=Letharia columbiana TaxID=112416 RepID=A0A8H6FYX7_9LECA|nr:uncharacterized protein HO173_004735 [Letharia columbiana]KAF6237266.1 hypothetical protein HO173_004735 [Letharia columbiana]